MRVVSFWYGPPDGLYARMARVLEWSASRYHETSVIHMPDSVADRSAAFELKARDWTRAINEARDGEILALLDADMIVARPLTGALREGPARLDDIVGDDIAVTSRRAFDRERRARAINSGAVFVRVSDRVRGWFAGWETCTRAWCAKNTLERIRFGDQDALSEMLRRVEGRGPQISIRYLACRQWNATQTEWSDRIPPSARILHVKSDARRKILEPDRPVKAGAAALARMWLELEAAAEIQR